jgi:hypothetical protein
MNWVRAFIDPYNFDGITASVGVRRNNGHAWPTGPTNVRTITERSGATWLDLPAGQRARSQPRSHAMFENSSKTELRVLTDEELAGVAGGIYRNIDDPFVQVVLLTAMAVSQGKVVGGVVGVNH